MNRSDWNIPCSMKFWVGPERRARAVRRGRQLRPALMPVEHRLLLSTFTVTKEGDNGADGTLRWAVERANATDGSNAIDFDPQVFNLHRTITLNGNQLVLANTTGTETIIAPAVGVTIYADPQLSGYKSKRFNWLEDGGS